MKIAKRVSKASSDTALISIGRSVEKRRARTEGLNPGGRFGNLVNREQEDPRKD